MSDINRHKFFSSNQFGFLPCKSTMDPLLILSKFVHKNLDCKNKVMGIFLDIQKAFDSVNHDILIIKT